MLLEAECKVNPVHDADDDGLPCDQVPEPVQELPVQDVSSLPAAAPLKDKNSTFYTPKLHTQIHLHANVEDLETPGSVI